MSTCTIDTSLDGCWAHLSPRVRVALTSSPTFGKKEKKSKWKIKGRRVALMSDILRGLKFSWGVNWVLKCSNTFKFYKLTTDCLVGLYLWDPNSGGARTCSNGTWQNVPGPRSSGLRLFGCAQLILRCLRCMKSSSRSHDVTQYHASCQSSYCATIVRKTKDISVTIWPISISLTPVGRGSFKPSTSISSTKSRIASTIHFDNRNFSVNLIIVY